MKTIRLMEKEDLELRYKAIVNPEINKWLVLPNASLEKTKKWFDSIITDDSRRDYAGLIDGKIFAFSGITHINHIDKSAELYSFLSDPYYFRKGLGSWIYNETINIGFKELGITKYISKVLKENIKKINFNLKLGLKKEGILEKEVWIDGSYHDIFLFAKILKERI